MVDSVSEGETELIVVKAVVQLEAKDFADAVREVLRRLSLAAADDDCNLVVVRVKTQRWP